MSKNVKTWIIIACVFILVGVVISLVSLLSVKSDFNKLNTATYKTNTYDVSELFNKINIEAQTDEVYFVQSADGKCKVECFVEENQSQTVSVESETLKINTRNNKKWYDYIGISIKTPKITVYLPQSEYASLDISTRTGDVEIPEDFSFQSINFSSDTADIDCYASVTDFWAKTSTGNISFSGKCLGKLEIISTTGEVEIENTVCKNLSISTTTGDVNLEKTVAEGKAEINTSTGKVHIEESDAAEISIKTTTGDVKGSLLSEKEFITETTTGDIDVPETASGGKCKIKTSTGDIDIVIK